MKSAFLVVLSAICSSVLAGGNPNRPPEPVEIDVAVAGLGLAGAEIMTLAKAAGRDPVAFESRASFGGRTTTIDVGEYTLTKGGSWQQGTGRNHPLTRRLSECSINNVGQNWNKWLDYCLDGQECGNSWGDFESSFACAEALSEQLKAEGVAPVSQDTGMRLCGWLAQNDDEYLVQDSTFRFEWAEPLSVTSLQSSLPWLTYSVYNDADNYITDSRGSQEMIGCWLDRYGFGRAASSKLNYNSAIANIDTDAQILTLVNGSRYHYQVLFNTIPIGVLSWNQAREDGSLFTPPLSPERQLALHGYHTPVYQKIFMQFPTAFWNDFSPNKEFFNIAPVASHSCTLWQNVDLPNWLPGSRIIYLTCTSPQSDYAENLSEDQWTELLMPELRRIFGSDIPSPDLVVVSRWKNDPNFRGTYSNRIVEGTGDRFDQLFEPFGTNESHILTGEAYCANLNGYMHGALLAAQTSWCEYQVRTGALPEETPCRAVATDADGEALPNFCFDEAVESRKRQNNAPRFARHNRISRHNGNSQENFAARAAAKLDTAVGRLSL